MQNQLLVESEYRQIAIAGSHAPDMGEVPLYDLLMSVKPDGLTPNAWAKRAGVSRSFFNDVRLGATPRTDTLEKVVSAIGMTLAQFYDLDETKRPVPAPLSTTVPFRTASEPKDLPLMGTAQGSDLRIQEDGSIVFIERMDLNASDVVDYLRRPLSLIGRRDVYAITVVGSSVSPKYEEGDPVYVDPKRQPSRGDYCVVQLRKQGDDGEDQLHIALLKEFVRRTSDYIELRQLNPDQTFQVPLADIHAVHRVIPWREIVFH